MKTSVIKSVALVTLSLFLANDNFSQVVGGTKNGEMTPKEVKPSELTSGGLQNDVNLFKGSYNASYPLGSVSTPGGVSYSLNLNYSPSFTTGETPAHTYGISYGDGWSLSIPKISVQADAYYYYSKAKECILSNPSIGGDELTYSFPLDSTYFYTYLDSNFMQLDTLSDLFGLDSVFVGFDTVTSTPISGYNVADLEAQVYHFSPRIHIPGVISGEFRFKYVDVQDAECMVFVPNKFEHFVEARWYGSFWRVEVDNGDVYTFKIQQVNYRSPANKRLLEYTSNANQNKVADFLLSPGTPSYMNGIIKNTVEPKEGALTYYCTSLSNKNLPAQNVIFTYEKNGAFNYFQEFKQDPFYEYYDDYIAGDLTAFNQMQDYTAYKDIRLLEIISYTYNSPVEKIELDYEILDQTITNQGYKILHPDDADVTMKDSLYAYKTVYNSADNNFGQWKRYRHFKSDQVQAASGTFNPATISPSNPYRNNSYYYRQNASVVDNKVKFDHSFLESPRLNTPTSELIAGEVYEIRTTISDNNNVGDSVGHSTIDINIVTGKSTTESQNFYQNNQFNTLNQNSMSVTNGYSTTNYDLTRGHQVFSTHNQMVKWQTQQNDSIITSNFFSLPSIPENYGGINIQIGPGASDAHYIRSTGDSELLSTMFYTDANNNDRASSYYAYHFGYAQLPAPLTKWYTPTPYNFGIGLPHSHLLPAYAYDLGGINQTSPKKSEIFQFWYNDDPFNYDYPNSPTKMNDQVALKSVELIRYSKVPSMLKSVKKYVVNGVSGPTNEDSLFALVDHKEFTYDLKKDTLYENFFYGPTDSIQFDGLSDYLSNGGYFYTEPNMGGTQIPGPSSATALNAFLDVVIYMDDNTPVLLRDSIQTIFHEPQTNTGKWYNIIYLEEIESVPLNVDIPNIHVGVAQPLHLSFSYEWFNPQSPDSVFTSVKARKGYIINEIVDHLGGITQIDYYSRNQKMWAHPLYDFMQETFNRCTAVAIEHVLGPSRAYEISPVVEKLKRADGFGTNRSGITWQETTYEYDSLVWNWKPGMILPGNFRGSALSLKDYGFSKVTVYKPEVSGENGKQHATYYFHGKHVQDLWTEIIDNSFSNYDFTSENPDDFLLFGKLYHVKNYAASGNLLSEQETQYDTQLAFENGGTRPEKLMRHWWYDYYDYYKPQKAHKNVETTTVSRPYNTTYHSPWDQESRLLEYFMGDLLAYLNPPHRLNSYFIKKTKTISSVYDTAYYKTYNTGNVIPSVPSAPQDPFYPDDYDNPAPTVDDATIIYEINNNYDLEDLNDYLIGESPLSDNVLLELLDEHTDEDLLSDVLAYQGRLSDDVMLAYINKIPVFTNEELYYAPFNSQTYLRDTVVKRASAVLPVYISDVELFMNNIMYKNPYTSDDVWEFWITNYVGLTNPEIFLASFIANQPQLPEHIQLMLVNTGDYAAATMSSKNLSDAFANQPVISDTVFQSLLENSNYTFYQKEDVITGASAFPSVEVQKEILNDYTGAGEFADNTIRDIFINAPGTLDTAVMALLELTLPEVLFDPIDDAQSGSNPLGQYCNEDRIDDTLGIKTITEYQYYDAAPDGYTHSKGYLKLLALEGIDTIDNPIGAGDLDSLQLRYEPSWQVYSTKTYSPHHEGAFSFKENFYYYDLANRYDRHPQYYDPNLWFLSSDDTTWYGDTIMRKYDVDVHGIDWTSTDYLTIDGVKYSQKNNLRNIVFQQTTTSKNAFEEDSIAKSMYFIYDNRWGIELNSSLELIDHELDTCAGDPDPPNLCDECYYVKNTNYSTIPDITPLGYCAYTNPYFHGSIYMCPEDFDHSSCENFNYYDTAYCNSIEVDTLVNPVSRVAPYTSIFEHSLHLSDVVEQIDTINFIAPTDEFNKRRVDTKNTSIIEFLVDWNEDDIPEMDNSVDPPAAPMYVYYPYDTLRVNHIDKINPHSQVLLETNERGIQTKYYYTGITNQWNYNLSCAPETNYMAIKANHIGLPIAVTVGYGRSDSMRTDYTYTRQNQLASITDYNHKKIEYEYDGFLRLSKVLENDSKIGTYDYSYWDGTSSDSFEERTEQNYTVQNAFTESYDGTRLFAFVNPLGIKEQTVNTDYSYHERQFSGIVEKDKLNRPFESNRKFFKNDFTDTDPVVPIYRYNGNDSTSRQLYDTRFAPKVIEAAKPGNSFASDKTVKTRTYIINKVVLACELSLNVYEVSILMAPDHEPDYRFFKTEVEDEDGKLTAIYKNAIGQKIATKAWSNSSTPIISLFVYDNYGNLTKVINPEKQESNYHFNIRGNMYMESNVDADTSKYVYDLSGNLVYSMDANGYAYDDDDGDMDDADSTRYYYKNTYDDYGRILESEKIDMNSYSGTGSEIIDNTVVDPFLFKDTSISNIILYDTSYSFQYKFSNRSTYAEYMEYDALAPPQGPGSPQLETFDAPMADHSETIKKWTYGNTFDTVNHTLGQVKTTESYNAEGDPIERRTMAYDRRGQLASELVEFDPVDLTTSVYDTTGLMKTTKIHYTDYDLQGKLLKMSVDVHNDSILDAHYQYAYDIFERLEHVYFGFDTDDPVRLATYEYDQDRDMVLQTHYENNDKTTGFTVSIDTIAYTYDVQNRLIGISSDLMEYRLYYDGNDPGDDAYYNGVLQDYNYNGNINATKVSYDFTLATGGPSQTFQDPLFYGYRYDDINRLVQADAIDADVANPGTADTYNSGDVFFSYDKVGNITNLTRKKYDEGATTLYQDVWTYHYTGGNNRLDSVDATDTSPTSDRYFAYDANGNLKSDNERNISDIQYHRKNYPYSITTSTADISYLYNAADLRIFKYVETATDTLTEYYLRNSSGQELGIYTADGDSTWAWYVYGNERIAKVVPEANQLPENTTPFGYNSDQTFYVREDDTLYHTEYYFTDHLGNTRIVYKGSSDNSTITREVSYMADYYPFGKTLREYAAGTEERYQFNGKEKDQATKYFDFGARLYDGEVGRFLGVDPMTAMAPHWTSYRFGFDNPVSMIDPSGMFETKYEDEDGNLLGETNDGNNSTVTIANEHKAAFNLEFKSAKKSNLTDNQNLNNSWRNNYTVTGETKKKSPPNPNWAMDMLNSNTSDDAKGGGGTLPEINSEVSAVVGLETTILSGTTDLTIKSLEKSKDVVPDLLKYGGRSLNVAGALWGIYDNVSQSTSDYKSGDYGRMTVNTTQAAGYTTGGVLLFTPAAPIGAAILLGTSLSDLGQYIYEKSTGYDYFFK